MIDTNENVFYIDYSRVRRHQKRVAKISGFIADIINLSEKREEILLIAARLHDYGKRIWVPSMIFKKKENLNEYEKNLIKTHPVVSSNLIRSELEIHDREMAERFCRHYPDVFKIIESHHENHDGSGYPFGLKGDEIYFEAAIIHVADAYDAIRSPRIYRGVEKQMRNHEDAINIVIGKTKIEFHPEIVEVFQKIPEKKLDSLYVEVSHLTKEKQRTKYGDIKLN